MSVYVMSDIHGQLNEFKEMLKKIKFNREEDTLYILGDYCDWGPDSIGVINYLRRLENSFNVVCLMGNHDKMMLETILLDRGKIKEEDCHLEDVKNIWFYNCGDETYSQFLEQSKYIQDKIVDWLQRLKLVVPDLEVNGRKYYLCHSEPYINGRNEKEVLWGRESPYLLNIELKKWLPDITLIKGHTIVYKYHSVDEQTGKCKIYREYDNLICIDCGGKVIHRQYSYRLGCLRLDDMQEFYVE